MAVTKATIAAQFNSIVRNALNTPAPGAAPWFAGNVPGVPDVAGSIPGDGQAQIQSHGHLGARAEPGKSAADIPGAAAMSSSVFNVLHGFAMELTRVRRAQYVVYLGNSAVYATNTAALHPRFALYFPIPGGQVEPGTVVTLADLNTFLGNLRSAVQNIRTNPAYLHTLTATAAACHSNCHGSCHGSRGRR